MGVAVSWWVCSSGAIVNHGVGATAYLIQVAIAQNVGEANDDARQGTRDLLEQY